MKRSLAIIVACSMLVGVGAIWANSQYHSAYAEGSADAKAAIDAGVTPASDGGVVTALDPATRVQVAPPVAPDPFKDPSGTVKEVREVYKDLGLVGAIAFGCFIVATVLSQRATPGSFLDRGRLPAILAAAVSSTGFLLMALKGTIGWDVALGGIMIAAGTVLQPLPKAKVTSA